MIDAARHFDTDDRHGQSVVDDLFGNRRGITQKIDDSTVTAALAIVDASGIADRIAEWRAADTDDRHPGGRPHALDDRAILALFVLMALEHTPLFVANIAHTLEHRLSPNTLAALGARQHPADGEGWYDRAWRAVHRFRDVIDPYPAPRRRMMTAIEFEEIAAKREPVVSEIKRARLDWVANALIGATWRMVPRDVRRRWKGNVCIDATPVSAFARGFSKRSPSTVEHDAAWYVREGDHRDRGDQNGRTVSKFLFGWEATIVIASTNDPTQRATFPLLATGIAFDKPGHNIAENAIIAFTSMRGRGMPAGLAAGDRAYWPNAKVDKLQLPMRALGYTNINDYREDQFGISAQHGGGIQVEGSWYCPSMPTPLVEATIDYRTRKTIDETTWRQRIEARTRYMLHAKESADADGHQPLRCPAIGPSATVACPLRATSMAPTKAAVRARVATPPEHPDRICTQTSVSFPPTAGAKHRQDIQYGTPLWHSMYATARNTIEGFNGYIKDGAHEALADPTRRRLRGRTAQHFLTAVLVMSANIRKLRTFLAELDAPPTRLAQIEKQRARRRRESITDYLPVSGTPPGEATTSATA